MILSEFVLVVMSLLALGVVLSGMFRRIPVPYTVMLVLLGLILGELSEQWESLAALQHLN